VQLWQSRQSWYVWMRPTQGSAAPQGSSAGARMQPDGPAVTQLLQLGVQVLAAAAGVQLEAAQGHHN
jgi:hypothetical protein